MYKYTCCKVVLNTIYCVEQLKLLTPMYFPNSFHRVPITSLNMFVSVFPPSVS